ncbi:MAG: hypothetical protein GY769_08180 [bacterium]|nr:hypothetical protein [bacterium]
MNLESVRETRDGLRWYVGNGGRTYPSVTTALGWVFHNREWVRYDMDAAHVVHARNKGRAIHTACYWMAKGRELDPASVDEELEPYIEQFRDFMRVTGFRPTDTEFLVVSQRYGYAGRGDLCGNVPEEKTAHLVDIKSGQLQTDMAGWQTAGYLRAWREMKRDRLVFRRCVLHLNGKGRDKWRYVGMSKPGDWAVFLSALNCFKAAEAGGML